MRLIRKLDLFQKMKRRSEKWERLLAVFIIGCILLNYPLLQIFSHDGMIAGIPTMYVYLFSSWILLIVVSAWVIERK